MMLSGNNGILTRAGEAKEITGEKQIGERVHLAYLASLTGGKGQATEELLRKELDNEFGKDGYELSEDLTKVTINEKEYEIGGTVVGENDEIDIKDLWPTDNSTMPYLPSDSFHVSEVSTEQTINGGLVITDGINEFVWVVVPRDGTTVYPNAGLRIENFTDEECTTIAKDLATYSGSKLPSINSGETFAKHIPPVGDGVPDYTSAYKDVLKSIYQNGGFYVGRYETGIQGTENETRSVRGDATQLAVIKENVQPYIYVTWEQAQTLAQGISAGKKGDKTSSLLMGVQWDLVLKFIGKDRSVDTNSSDWGNYRDSVFNLKKGSHYAKKSSVTLSTTWKAYNEDEAGFVESSEKKSQSTIGNGILYTTGANTTNNSKKNICDIAGNVWEWTIENTSSPDFPCSARGGEFFDTGASFPASSRYPNFTAASNFYLRFSCFTLLVDLSTDSDKL